MINEVLNQSMKFCLSFEEFLICCISNLAQVLLADDLRRHSLMIDSGRTWTLTMRLKLLVMICGKVCGHFAASAICIASSMQRAKVPKVSFVLKSWANDFSACSNYNGVTLP